MFITGPPIQSGDVPSCDFMYAKAFILFYLFNIMITNPNPFKCRDSKHHFSSSWSVSTACKFNFVEGCFFFLIRRLCIKQSSNINNSSLYSDVTQ